jgi:hypothetical protein
MEKHFLEWALDLEEKCNLKLVWHNIDFSRKCPDQNGYYNQLENPDTTNGNLKFWFVFQGESWTPTL